MFKTIMLLVAINTMQVAVAVEPTMVALTEKLVVLVGLVAEVLVVPKTLPTAALEQLQVQQIQAVAQVAQ